MVERNLAKVDVEGSNPFSRSTLTLGAETPDSGESTPTRAVPGRARPADAEACASEILLPLASRTDRVFAARGNGYWLHERGPRGSPTPDSLADATATPPLMERIRFGLGCYSEYCQPRDVIQSTSS